MVNSHSHDTPNADGTQVPIDHAERLNALNKLEMALELPRLLETPLHFVLERPNTKEAYQPNWQEKPPSLAVLKRRLDPSLNGKADELGLATGEVSGWLLRGDYDQPETATVAQHLMPPTGIVAGRKLAPHSAPWFHVVSNHDAVASKIQLSFKGLTKLTGPDGKPRRAKVGELLTNGQQSVIPTSNHAEDPGGYRWDHFILGSADVDGLDCAARMRSTLIGGLLAIFAPEHGERHDFDLALQGFLCAYSDWSNEWISEVIRAIAHASGRDEDWQKRGVLAEIERTCARVAQGEKVTGKPTLAALLGDEGDAILKVICAFMGWARPAHGPAAQQASAQAGAQAGLSLGPDLLPLAADGDGLRFAQMWRGQALYCAEEDQWYLYDGMRWQADRVGAIAECAKQTTVVFRTLVQDAARIPGSYNTSTGVASYRDCAQWAQKMGNVSRLNDMLQSARTLEALRITPEQFDADPRLMTLLDGTLVMDTANGTLILRPHDSADHITKLAPVHYRRDATHPLFTQYLDRFFPEADRRAFLQEMGGYCFTGIPKRHGLQLIGPHDAGKSTTLKLLEGIFGEYAGSLADTNLMRSQHKGGDVGRPDLMRVLKMRLVTVKEVEPGARLDAALFKTLLSGGDTMALRTFFDKTGGIDATFHFSLWLSGNRPYGPPPEEAAAYDRLEVLSCDHVIPEAERNPDDEVATTDPSVVGDTAFAFFAEGFERLYGQQGGVPCPPQSSRDAKVALREDLDSFTDAIADIFIITHDAHDGVKKSEAWQRVRTLLEDAGEKIARPRAVQKKFEEAMEWRVGKPKHLRERWGDCDFWPGVQWSEKTLEQSDRYVEMMRRQNPTVQVKPLVSRPDWGE